MKSERDKLAAKIRALLSKTVENGCTEEEALSAAQMAAALLEKHNMTVDETQLRENPMRRETYEVDDLVGERLWKVARSISLLTGSRYWTSAAGVHPVEINFFGFEHEVEVARYLLEICARATRQAGKRVERDNLLLVKRKRVQARIAFVDGMIDRLAERIEAMVPPAATGTGLVVLRDQLIDAAMDVKLGERKQRRSRDFDPNYAHGVLEGERVALNSGVSSDRYGDAKRLR